MEDRELVRRGFDAFAQGDMATLQGLMHPDVVWHNSGSGPLSGDFKGEEVFAMFGRLFEETQGTARQEVHALTEGDGHVVAVTKATATRNGKSLASDNVIVFHVDDGKVTEVWNTPFDQATADEFWT